MDADAAGAPALPKDCYNGDDPEDPVYRPMFQTVADRALWRFCQEMGHPGVPWKAVPIQTQAIGTMRALAMAYSAVHSLFLPMGYRFHVGTVHQEISTFQLYGVPRRYTVRLCPTGDYACHRWTDPQSGCRVAYTAMKGIVECSTSEGEDSI